MLTSMLSRLPVLLFQKVQSRIRYEPKLVTPLAAVVFYFSCCLVTFLGNSESDIRALGD